MAGTFRSYFLGQCTAYVAQLLSWVPAGWGNAYQWLVNAESQGYQTTTNLADVVPGSIAVYQSSLPGSGGDGHVAVVTSVNPGAGTFGVTEENFTGGPGVVDQRTSSTQYLEGFILPPSSATAFDAANYAQTGGSSTTQGGSSTPSGLLTPSPALKSGVGAVLAVLGGLTLALVGVLIAVKPHLPKAQPVPVPV